MKPVSRYDLIRKMRRLGFDGPYSGGKHAFMIRNNKRVPLPNPHHGDISVGLLQRILKQAAISDIEWQSTD
ncbi:MAG: type II toxin-antitoxin system HicA family toxin [Bacteroidota bacterium]|jgi:predicted RNA binding protein YcfA (HicA-like mRNA interferase family)